MIELLWPWALLALPLPLLAYWGLPVARREEAALQVPFFRIAAQYHAQTGRSKEVDAVQKGLRHRRRRLLLRVRRVHRMA